MPQNSSISFPYYSGFSFFKRKADTAQQEDQKISETGAAAGLLGHPTASFGHTQPTILVLDHPAFDLCKNLPFD